MTRTLDTPRVGAAIRDEFPILAAPSTSTRARRAPCRIG